ncbi:hypothetical protein [Fictibacillus phosphorivorans]|uniref:hypothetical protein n=1 Tax=Fictibacillus phosphorivorans TaxID=1221500 RepID=UPI0012939D72|nr:hypothetical protein [Fictibacillus phosphorivorans]MQR97178.1 hypothetical protein [Fictibacillus phosphorivorans]
MTELVRIGLMAILGTQGAYFLAIFLAGNTMIDWYEWGTFRNADTVFTKTVNVLSALFMGIAYWSGKRVDHHNWFVKRIYLLGYAFLYTIAGILFYELCDYFLRFIENY